MNGSHPLSTATFKVLFNHLQLLPSFPKNSPKNKYPSVFPKNIPRNEFLFWIWEDFLSFSLLFLPKTTFLRVFSQKTAPKNAFFIFLYVLRETHFAFFCESHFAFSFFSFSLKIHTILFLFFFPPVFPIHLKTAGFGIFFAKCLSETLCFSGFFFFSVFFSIKKTLLRIVPLQGFLGIFFYFYS